MIRMSPARSGGSRTIYRAKREFGQISVSSEFIATDDDTPHLVMHAGSDSAVMAISPEDLIELGKSLIEEGIRLQQRPTE